METFTIHLDWCGAEHGPARDPATFSRDLLIAAGATRIPASAAPRFHGDASRANPEELFIAAISACQALTYSFLAARAGVPVTRYADEPEGTLGIVDGKLRMASVTLRPSITIIAGADESTAKALIEKAHQTCFIANSVATPVTIEPAFWIEAL